MNARRMNVNGKNHPLDVDGDTAALWGEITLADGRVQQSNFHDVRVLRMSEAPKVETHIVASGAAPGGMGEAGKRLRKLPVGGQLRPA